MRSNQSGFTLIELVVVIVLLGILGVTASAKFADLSTAAQTATAQGVASEIGAGSILNYGDVLVNGATASINSSTLCGGLGSLLGAGAFPTDISVVNPGNNLNCSGSGDVDNSNCEIGHLDGGSTTFAVVTCDS